MKEPNKSKECESEGDVDPVLDGLAQAVIDTIMTENKENAEAFDLYIHKVHSSVYSDTDLACSRFIKGYHTLLEELNK